MARETHPKTVFQNPLEIITIQLIGIIIPAPNVTSPFSKRKTDIFIVQNIFATR